MRLPIERPGLVVEMERRQRDGLPRYADGLWEFGESLLEGFVLGQGGTHGAACVFEVSDPSLFECGARTDNAHSNRLVVLQREVDETLVNDPAHHLAVESLALMNKSEDDDDVNGVLLEEMFGC